MDWPFKQFVKLTAESANCRHTLSCLVFALVFILALGVAGTCAAQSGPSPAGEIRSLVPVGQIVRGTTPAVAAKVHDPLYWQDTLRTERGGRIRIGLLDGSILNLGSQSSLTITKHNPAAQQTDLELTYGRVRSRAVHITQPGGSFKVRTPVAVTGVVGTSFDVRSAGDETLVLCLENSVRVSNVDDRVKGEVTLQAGEFTQVRKGKPPTKPKRATPDMLREGEDATSIAASEVDWSRVEISLPPQGCGQDSTVIVHAWARPAQGGESETPIDPERIAGKLIIGDTAIPVNGGRATLTKAPKSGAATGKFVPEGSQASVAASIQPAIKMVEGKGWRTARAAFAGSSISVLGPGAVAQPMALTIGDHPATVIWSGACGAGFATPSLPGGIYKVAVSVGGQVVARGEINLVAVSYDVPKPPVLLRGQTTKVGVILHGLSGLDQFVQGHPIEVTTLTNDTPAILGSFRSKTRGAHGKGNAIVYRVEAGNVDASGTVRLEATGSGRQKGEFHLSVESKLDESLTRPDHPLTPVQQRP